MEITDSVLAIYQATVVRIALKEDLNAVTGQLCALKSFCCRITEANLFPKCGDDVLLEREWTKT